MGRHSTVDLLVLTSYNELRFVLKTLLTFFTKQAILMMRLIVLSLPPQLVLPGLVYRETISYSSKKFYISGPWLVVITLKSVHTGGDSAAGKSRFEPKYLD